MEIINLTPTWEQILGVLLMLYDKGDSEGRGTALEELTRMAKLADLYVASQKSQEKGK